MGHCHCAGVIFDVGFASSQPSALEGNAGEVALTPNQPALPDGAKIVEGQLKIGRQDVDVVQPNSGADVGDVAQAAAEYAALGAKKQQGAFRDLRPAN